MKTQFRFLKPPHVAFFLNSGHYMLCSPASGGGTQRQFSDSLPPECLKTQFRVTAYTIFCACVIFGPLYIVSPAERGIQYTQFSDALPLRGARRYTVQSIFRNVASVLFVSENGGFTDFSFCMQIFLLYLLIIPVSGGLPAAGSRSTQGGFHIGQISDFLPRPVY